MKLSLRIIASVILAFIFISFFGVTTAASVMWREEVVEEKIEEKEEERIRPDKQPPEEPQKDQEPEEEIPEIPEIQNPIIEVFNYSYVDFLGIEVDTNSKERIDNQLSLYYEGREQDFEQKYQESLQFCSQVNKRSNFKSWTDYRALGKKTPNYKLCSAANVDENGLLVYNGHYLVAMGSGWGVELGNIFLIVTDEGNVFSVMICDEKADKDTDSTNTVTRSNGCMVEFYIRRDLLNHSVKRHGTVGKLPQFSGKIIAVIPLEEEEAK